MATTKSAIYTPRASISLLLGLPNEKNKCTCTKIPYQGYEISISMDSSHLHGDLSRSDLLVMDALGEDITERLFPEFSGVVPATAQTLKEAFSAIDAMALKPV